MDAKLLLPNYDTITIEDNPPSEYANYEFPDDLNFGFINSSDYKSDVDVVLRITMEASSVLASMRKYDYDVLICPITDTTGSGQFDYLRQGENLEDTFLTSISALLWAAEQTIAELGPNYNNVSIKTYKEYQDLLNSMATAAKVRGDTHIEEVTKWNNLILDKLNEVAKVFKAHWDSPKLVLQDQMSVAHRVGKQIEIACCGKKLDHNHVFHVDDISYRKSYEESLHALLCEPSGNKGFRLKRFLG